MKKDNVIFFHVFVFIGCTKEGYNYKITTYWNNRYMIITLKCLHSVKAVNRVVNDTDTNN